MSRANFRNPYTYGTELHARCPKSQKNPAYYADKIFPHDMLARGVLCLPGGFAAKPTVK